MSWIFLTVTAITVSLDSFIAGFSLSLNKRNTFLLPLTVAVVTFVLCMLAALAGNFLKDFLQNGVNYFGATILILLGISSLCKNDQTELTTVSFSQCLSIGFGVGMDGAAATLSLVMQGGDVFFIPFLFAITHLVTVSAGQFFATSAKAQNTNIVSAILFFVLAMVKLLNL